MRAVHELSEVKAAFRQWPSIAVKGFLWKHLDLPRRELQIQSRLGTRMVIPLVRNVGALYGAIEVFALAQYDYDWKLGRDPFVVDVGANVGAWLLWLAERQPGLSGVCYEPDPAARAFLERNLELNGLADTVEIRPEAVSDQTGTAALYQSEPGEGASSLYPDSPVVQFERETTVQTLSFAEAMKRIDGEVALLKLDCEGAEYKILRGSPPEAWQRVRRVVLEYHPAKRAEQVSMRRRFGELGFSVMQERRNAADLGTLWLERRAV
jgi:FkbM family methyltransferase